MVIAAVTQERLGAVVPPGGAHHAHVRQSFQASLESIAAGEVTGHSLTTCVSVAHGRYPFMIAMD
jgi:hypothetical protein